MRRKINIVANRVRFGSKRKLLFRGKPHRLRVEVTNNMIDDSSPKAKETESPCLVPFGLFLQIFRNICVWIQFATTIGREYVPFFSTRPKLYSNTMANTLTVPDEGVQMNTNCTKSCTNNTLKVGS